MANLEGCQLPSLPKFALGPATLVKQPLKRRIQRLLVTLWDQHGGKWFKRLYHSWFEQAGPMEAQLVAKEFAHAIPLKTGDWVRVRSRREIEATLDPFNELKGCAFQESMSQYCGTQQRVFKAMQRYLDEHDYKIKEVHGVVLLQNVICQGAPAFGACDRCCFLFWREEWLEKII